MLIAIEKENYNCGYQEGKKKKKKLNANNTSSKDNIGQ
jgi:hypothetical protein